MQTSTPQVFRRATFEMLHDLFDALGVPANHRMTMIETNCARVHRDIAFLARLRDSGGDALPLLFIETHRRIFQLLFSVAAE